jgi:hypothetical protein
MSLLNIGQSYQDLRTRPEFAWQLNLGNSYWEGPCSSSWAVTVAMVATHEYNAVKVTSKDPNLHVKFSYQHLIDCCTTCYEFWANPCDGGDYARAMNYLVSTGVVTGANFGASGGSGGTPCKNYKYAECTLSVAKLQTTSLSLCTDAELDIGSPPIYTCTNVCDNGSAGTLYKMLSVQQPYRYSSIASYMGSITDSSTAPHILIAEMQVYEDILSFDDPTKIYMNLYGRMMGTVVVAIYGFMYDSTISQEYWIVRFPWGNQFGDNGFLKVLKNKNICGIELSGQAYYFTV